MDSAGCMIRQSGNFRRLLLLHPVTGAVDQMTADHVGTRARLHRLEYAGALMRAPILLSRDEGGRHVDGTAREGLQFGVESARRAAAIPLQSALESGAPIFGGIEGKLAVGQPPVRRNL